MKEILPFIAKWMNIGNTMLSEVNQRQILYWYHLYTTLKCNTNECVYKTETDSQIHRYRKQACRYQRREEKGVGRMRGLVLSYTDY